MIFVEFSCTGQVRQWKAFFLWSTSV